MGWWCCPIRISWSLAIVLPLQTVSDIHCLFHSQDTESTFNIEQQVKFVALLCFIFPATLLGGGLEAFVLFEESIALLFRNHPRKSIRSAYDQAGCLPHYQIGDPQLKQCIRIGPLSGFTTALTHPSKKICADQLRPFQLPPKASSQYDH